MNPSGVLLLGNKVTFVGQLLSPWWSIHYSCQGFSPMVVSCCGQNASVWVVQAENGTR